MESIYIQIQLSFLSLGFTPRLMRAMQEKKKKKKDVDVDVDDSSNYPPLLGICQRLFYFFFDGLIASGFKSITLGHPSSMAADASVVEKQNNSPSKLNPETAAMPVYYVDRENSMDHDDLGFKKGKSGSLDIEPNQIPVSRPRTSTVKDSSTVEEDKTRSRGKKKNVEAKESEEKKMPSNSRTPLTLKDEEEMKKAKTPPRTSTVKDSSAEEEKTKSKGKKKNVETREGEEKKTPSSSRTPLTLKDEEGMKKAKIPPSPITVRPLLGGNINEESDAYIRSRKAAMTGSTS